MKAFLPGNDIRSLRLFDKKRKFRNSFSKFLPIVKKYFVYKHVFLHPKGFKKYVVKVVLFHVNN